MNRLIRNADWLAAIAALVLAVMAWHYSGVDTLATRGYRARTEHVQDEKVTLGKTLADNVSAPKSQARDVGVVAVYTLSALRHRAALSGVIVNRVEITGGTSIGSGWQNLGGAAHQSSYPGLRFIDAHIEGQWKTISGLMSFLSIVGHRPAGLIHVEISDGYYKAMVKIYGI